MLDAISDFWKPMKKAPVQEKLHPEQLRAGSVLGFGFVPQSHLSGARLHVSAINTYQFGHETLTSFVLLPEGAPAALDLSLIVAEADGEQYLAISRRFSAQERAQMFDAGEFETALSAPEPVSLSCRSLDDFRGWTVSSYRREMQGVKGAFYRGDWRKEPMPVAERREFSYALLVSDGREHAIEIERYADGRIETFATVYRRLVDIADVTYTVPQAEPARPDLKLASDLPRLPASAPAQASQGQEPPAASAKPAPIFKTAATLSSLSRQSASPKPLTLEELSPPAPAAPAKAAETPAPAVAGKPVPVKEMRPVIHTMKKENPTMLMSEPLKNGSAEPRPASAAPASQFPRQEIRAVSKTPVTESDSIECELKVANRIIEEAIRNEMRLSDIVRRIVELPVANPESVQLPIVLSEEDYKLLSIRYGIGAADRLAIKAKIADELGEFSGAGK